MIIYNKKTKQLLDSATVSDFDIVFFERDPDYNYIKPTPQQEADYILQQSKLQLANNKTIAINQLQTLKTNAIDKLQADNFANIIKTILTQNQSAIDNIIAVDIKLDNINTVLAESITEINKAINQTAIDNAVATFSAIL